MTCSQNLILKSSAAKATSGFDTCPENFGGFDNCPESFPDYLLKVSRDIDFSIASVSMSILRFLDFGKETNLAGAVTKSAVTLFTTQERLKCLRL